MARNKVSPGDLLRRELDIYKLFCDKAPPADLVADGARSDELQRWVSMHLKDEFNYATAISVMDAARAIAESQIDNGREELHLQG